ncbi:bifunctional methylenetetrahydrofolate dehydrogenase/methenyltetrahydrofolate cyclohydrolase [Natrialba sp. PRR66]|uniref:bifunctional methylenetetrahydrofolate dehydrogenase/methenyltetrahydrofolate cyclohydrolase n=1 Tax=Natrialba sp. PRR66 TaxID=3098146 RepID=UPI002B1DE74F|nr:bifunctional methylenetetrahydrofolate dehydrogenase/methenyltetrahydrofolate cyclohydrolase [Natrialba sp. PRR66]
MTEIIDGNAVASQIRDDLTAAIETLADAGARPGLATVLMGDDPASQTYVNMKQRDCEEVGIESHHVDVDGDASPAELYDAIADLNEDPDVHGYIVQAPVPDHVDYREVIRRVDPIKDVDGFHPENVGRLVAGDARFRPCTPHGIQKLLETAGVEPEGKDVTIVGRSDIVGKPLANLLIQKAEDGNATVTVCHSRTDDLGAKTRAADIVVAAVGVPELIDGSMIGEGAVVIDVGVNRVDVSERRSEDSQTASDQSDTEKGYELVGDVEFESAKEKASAITPVPGGVGPMTRAMLLYNTVKAASLQEDVAVDLP